MNSQEYFNHHITPIAYLGGKLVVTAKRAWDNIKRKNSEWQRRKRREMNLIKEKKFPCPVCGRVAN